MRLNSMFVSFALSVMVVLPAGVLAKDHNASLGPVPRNAASIDRGTPTPASSASTVGYSWGLSLATFTFGWNTVDLGSGAVTNISTGSSVFYSGGDFDASGAFYAFDFYLEQLVTIDVGTGAATVIGPSPLPGSQVWEGLTYDHSTGNWYGSSTDITTAQLYSVNIATGGVTLIGTMTGSAGGMICISANCAGQLYGYDIVDDNFYSIDKTTGAATLIGPLGFDANYAQDMDFDPETDVCYLGAFNLGTFNGELRTADVTTGATTLVGATGYEHTAFGIPGTCGDPCEDYTAFLARCNNAGNVQARVTLSMNIKHSGETIMFQIDETLYGAVIGDNGTSSRASISVSGLGSGDHTVTVVDPAGCFDPRVVTCPAFGKADAEWEADDARWAAESRQAETPAATKLLGNYPNPFNPTTSISYQLSADGWVTLKIYNTLGEEVATLVNEYQTAGTRSAVWNGTNDAGSQVATGIYIYRLTAGNIVTTEKMMFVK